MPLPAIASALGSATAIGAVGVVSGGFFDAINQGVNTALQLSLVDPIRLISLKQRGLISDEDYNSFMRRQGYDTAQVTNLENSQQQVLNVAENVNLYRRGLLANGTKSDEAVYFENMKKIHIDQDTATQLLTASEVLETPQALVTFAVREAYNDEIAKEFKYDEDLPPRTYTEAAKIGISRDLLQLYWRAHWQLPSPSQMFEAQHRYDTDIIDDAADDLKFLDLKADDIKTDKGIIDRYLRTADFPEFFRNRLRAISYSNLTRVDVRRMIRLGLLTYRQVTYNYRKQGYTPVDSRRLTKFGYVYESLPRWKDGIVNGTYTIDAILQEATAWEIKTTSSDVTEQTENELIISSIRREIQPVIDEALKPERDQAKSTILQAFVLGIRTEEQTLTALQDIRYDAAQSQFIIDVEKAKLDGDESEAVGMKKSTRGEIKAAFRANLISREQAITQLQAINIELQAATLIIDIEEAKEK